jgi:hypothetical protein
LLKGEAIEETWIFKRDITSQEEEHREDQPFSLNKHVMTRLDQWDQSINEVM